MKRALLLLMLWAVCLTAADPRSRPASQPQATDPLSRLVGSPQAVNTTLGFEAVEQKHPFRRMNGEDVDLRPLFSWINRGKVVRGKKPFAAECPAPEWRPIGGTIVSVMDDAILLSRSLSRTAVVIKHYPTDLNPAKGDFVTVVAVKAGSFDYEADGGRKESLPVYDYGVPFIPPVAPGTNVVGDANTFTNPPPDKPKRVKRR